MEDRVFALGKVIRAAASSKELFHKAADAGVFDAPGIFTRKRGKSFVYSEAQALRVAVRLMLAQRFGFEVAAFVGDRIDPACERCAGGKVLVAAADKSLILFDFDNLKARLRGERVKHLDYSEMSCVPVTRIKA